jgi:hypothetical protein
LRHNSEIADIKENRVVSILNQLTIEGSVLSRGRNVEEGNEAGEQPRMYCRDCEVNSNSFCELFRIESGVDRCDLVVPPLNCSLLESCC